MSAMGLLINLVELKMNKYSSSNFNLLLLLLDIAPSASYLSTPILVSNLECE